MVKRGLATRVGGIDEPAVRALFSHLVEVLGDAAGQGPGSRAGADFPVTVMIAPNDRPDDVLGHIVGVPDTVDVVITTSGSTRGVGQPVGLSLPAMVASARATHARLSGPGQWLTSLPIHHVAGFQVMLRSAVAGIAPVVHVPGRPMREEVASLRADVPRYLSLVPTQLMRALETDADALATFDAILVGGAGLSPSLADAAARAGARIVTTYGMTETSGGCVYDGIPLDGARVRLVDGIVELAGPMLAEGYLDGSASPFAVDGDTRWLRTADLGRWAPDEAAPGGRRLEILGRADDVVISGGVNVAPRVVENALESAFGGLWVAVGVPDERWGDIVVAVTAAPPTLAAVREATAHLEPAYRPRGIVELEIPHRASGKVDRRETARLARELVRDGRAELHR